MFDSRRFPLLALIGLSSACIDNNVGKSPTYTSPPVADIVQPVATGVYYSNMMVAFEAYVSDEQQTDATLLTVAWESSVDGLLEPGPSMVPDTSGHVTGTAYLTEAPHFITLTATDLDGETTTQGVAIEVGPPNTAPSCAIISPIDESTASYGLPVSLEGSVSDPNIPSNQLTAVWTDEDGNLLAISAPTTTGAVYGTADDLPLGNHVITLVVTDEVGATCTAASRLTVGGGPVIEILTPTDGQEFYAGDLVEFGALVTDDQTAANDLVLSWESDVDGVFSTSDADSFGNATATYAGLSEGEQYITLTATDEDGLQASAGVAIQIVDCTRSWYRDADNDGYGNSADVIESCEATEGYVEVLGDCDDAAPSINPGAVEACNLLDDDCDGAVDEDVVYSDWYADADADSYGDASATPVHDCVAPPGSVADFSDCDDASRTVHPGATETCNGVDDNCDGFIDEGLGTTWYGDADGDSYGSSSTTTTACSAPSGYVSISTDCNDTSASVHPGAAEACNSVDDDCDGSIDEDAGSTWYRDADGDSYGSVSTTMTACSAPSGYVSTSTDCNDASSSVHPYASETCNGIDDNCDGSIDEGVIGTYYRDADGDSYGAASSGTSTACAMPSGYSTLSTDCNDASASVHPGGTEVCNSVDDDCDGVVDDGVGSTYYRDADGDSYGSASASTLACSTPSGYVSNATDCNDASGSVHPGATETCNSVDDDCDGSTDEGLGSTYYRDADGDGYGSSSSTTTACSRPSGYATTSSDCDDSDSGVHPSASEVGCDGVDQDCDGLADDGALEWTPPMTASGSAVVSTTTYLDVDFQDDGSGGIELQVCKHDGSKFTSNIYVSFDEWVKYTGAWTDLGYQATSGTYCTGWISHPESSIYWSEGEGFGGYVQIESYSTGSRTWGRNCTDDGSTTGDCWSIGTGIMTLTCSI